MNNMILPRILALFFFSNFIQAYRPGGGWSRQSHTYWSENQFDSPVNNSDNSENNPILVIKDGILRGFTMQTISGRSIAAFQNIPYAQPPISALRFKEPRKNLPWIGIRDAIKQSPDCVQIDSMRQQESLGQEDCLYLNVYTPRASLFTSKTERRFVDLANKKLPVLLFLHGGSFLSGAGSLYGPRYLLERDVILVTIQYRLGAFGFLSTGDDASPGNNGMKDQEIGRAHV